MGKEQLINLISTLEIDEIKSFKMEFTDYKVEKKEKVIEFNT